MSKQTITRCIEELSHDVSEQLKDPFHTCSFFSLALDESEDMSEVAQLSIFIRGVDNNFNVFEELIGLESLQRRTRGLDLFDKIWSCLEQWFPNFFKSRPTFQNINFRVPHKSTCTSKYLEKSTVKTKHIIKMLIFI